MSCSILIPNDSYYVKDYHQRVLIPIRKHRATSAARRLPWCTGALAMGFWKTCKECVKLVWGVACLWIAWKGCTLSFRFLGWAARYVERSVVFTALLTKRTAQ